MSLMKDFPVHCVFIDQDGIKVLKQYNFDGVGEVRPLREFGNPLLKFRISILETRVPLTSTCCQKLIDMARSYVATATDFTIGGEIECTAAEFGDLLKAFRISRIDTSYYIPQEFFDTHAMKEINRLFLGSSGITNQQLLQLKCETFRGQSENVTDEGVNVFLKQWLAGERQIDNFTIRFDSSKEMGKVASIFEGITANPVWTPELHSQSIISGLPIEEIAEDERVPYYSIWKYSDIHNPRLVRISDTSIEVRTCEEVSYVQMMISPDQMHRALGVLHSE